MKLTLAEVAQQVSGEFTGDGSLEVTGLSSPERAKAGDLIFAEKESYLVAAEESAAIAILVPKQFSSSKKPLVRVDNPRAAVAKLLPLFFPTTKREPGVHPSSIIAPDAVVDPSAHVGPHCVIGANVRIGARSILTGGNHLGADASVGSDALLHPNVVVAAGCQLGNRVIVHAGSVIGSDGYGYVFDQGRHLKIAQVGNVIIQDDVEIGANVAIDRGALDSTIIGQGTKIDNLVHIAHNVVMGKHCLILGQAGFAGSTHLGDYCIVASQSGIAGHLKLGTKSTVAAKSGVMRDVPPGATVLGTPAQPDKQMKRQWIALQQLPDLVRQIRDLQKQVEDLKTSLDSTQSSHIS